MSTVFKAKSCIIYSPACWPRQEKNKWRRTNWKVSKTDNLAREMSLVAVTYIEEHFYDSESVAEGQ
jgi:hypothetical protein